MRLTYHLSGTHTGFDHRIGHFRPLRMATRVTECHIYLRVRGFSLANRLLGWRRSDEDSAVSGAKSD
jgi:hypothetical protein